MTKEVKFSFYEIDYKIHNNLLDFTLKDYFKEPLNIKDSLFEMNNYKAFLYKYYDNIYVFRKYKKDFLPKIGDENGNIRNINLKDDEYIIEENAVILDFDNNIVVYHQNHAGFNISALQQYLQTLLQNKIEHLYFKPVILKNTIEKLKNSPIIKQANIRISRVNVATLSALGFNDEEIRKFIDVDSASGIEIIIKSKKNHAISTLEKIKDLLSKDFFDKFRVKASSSYEGSGEDIDILDNILAINKKIKIKNKRADLQDLIIKIQEVYNEYLPQIKKP
jgi:hypothetical protein